jgi:hypothetical protein
MRTKTLLLVAALGAAGFATALAQSNVYSLNVVGYVNAPLPASTVGNGFAILCNPLNNGGNSLAEIIPTAPADAKVYRYVNNSWVSSTYQDDGFGNFAWSSNMVLNPGEGFWVKNTGVATNLTFVGEVQQGNTTNAIPSGFALRGSIVPQQLILWDPLTTAHGSNDLNYVATADQTVIYLFRNAAYRICSFQDDGFGNLSWSQNPVPQVGEGFWTKESAPKSWVRNFNVQ